MSISMGGMFRLISSINQSSFLFLRPGFAAVKIGSRVLGEVGADKRAEAVLVGGLAGIEDRYAAQVHMHKRQTS